MGSVLVSPQRIASRYGVRMPPALADDANPLRSRRRNYSRTSMAYVRSWRVNICSVPSTPPEEFIRGDSILKVHLAAQQRISTLCPDSSRRFLRPPYLRPAT